MVEAQHPPRIVAFLSNYILDLIFTVAPIPPLRAAHGANKRPVEQRAVANR